MSRPTTIGNNFYVVTSANRAAAPGPLTGGTTIPGNGSSGIIQMGYRDGNFQCTIELIISAGASGTWSVQYTADNIYGNDINDTLITGVAAPNPPGPPLAETAINWFTHPSFNAVAVSGISNIAFPVTAIRLIANTWVSGSAYIRVIQTPVAA